MKNKKIKYNSNIPRQAMVATEQYRPPAFVPKIFQTITKTAGATCNKWKKKMIQAMPDSESLKLETQRSQETFSLGMFGLLLLRRGSSSSPSSELLREVAFFFIWGGM